MATVHDVAAFILESKGVLKAERLHQLLYFSQAWSLVWDRRPLFDEPLLAWPQGPISPDVLQLHFGMTELTEWPMGDSSALDAAELETVQAVLDSYAHLSPLSMQRLLERDPAWLRGRRLLAPEVCGDIPIDLEDIYDHFAPPHALAV